MASNPMDAHYKKLNQNVCKIRNSIIPYASICYIKWDTSNYYPTIVIYLKEKHAEYISFEHTDSDKRYNLCKQVFDEIVKDAWPTKEQSEQSELVAIKHDLEALKKELNEVRENIVKLLTESDASCETEDLLNIENNIVINGATLGATSLD